MITSRLFQTKLSSYDLQFFRSPPSQLQYEIPMNCAAVTAQLIGLISHDVSEAYTKQQKGVLVKHWSELVSHILESPITIEGSEINNFNQFFMDNLFPGYATFVLAVAEPESKGHYFVVGKTGGKAIVVIDPQIRKIYTNVEEYFNEMKWFVPKYFVYMLRQESLTPKQHEDDYINYFLSKHLSECLNAASNNQNHGISMDIDEEGSAQKVDTDVQMAGLLSNRTLRRMNRRRRVF